MSTNKNMNKNQGEVAPDLWFVCIPKAQCHGAGWCCTFITAFLHLDRQHWEYTIGALASDTHLREGWYMQAYAHTGVCVYICAYTHIKI